MSIVKVDKNKYRIFISDGFNLDGSRRRHTKTITTDLKGRDLKRFLIMAELDFEDEVKNKGVSYNNMADKTLSNFIKWWLDYVDLTAQTKESYMYNLKYIEKYIGHKTISQINQSDMLELLEIVKNKKKKNTDDLISKRTVRNHMNALKSVFNTALELEIIKVNPLANVKYSVDNYQLKDNYYDVDDINKMVFALDKEPVVYQLAILLTLSIGTRLGELVALCEDDFNRQNHSVEISKALSETVGKKEFALTKTKKSRIEFYPEEIDLLLEKHLEEEKVKKEYLGVDNNLIFTGIEGGFIAKKTLSDWFRRFLKRNDLKVITFHGLRHTSATILLANGIPLKNVAERLGHSRASTTSNIYAHAIPRLDKESANVFQGILQSGTKSGTKKDNLRIIK